jgi:hypothetical protein
MLSRIQLTMTIFFVFLIAMFSASFGLTAAPGFPNVKNETGSPQGQSRDQDLFLKGQQGQNDRDAHQQNRSGQDPNNQQDQQAKQPGQLLKRPLDGDAEPAKQAVRELIESRFGSVKDVKFTRSTYEERNYAMVWAYERGLSLLPGGGIYGVEFTGQDDTKYQCTYIDPINDQRVILRNCVIELNLEKAY